MGVGPQYTIAQLDENGVAVPISVDNPLKISGGGGGSGAVDSVNGQTGEVVLDADDVGAVTKVYVDSNFMQVVAHGTNASMERPAGAVAVYWKGSVEPTNATDDDLWIGGN